MGTLKFGIIGFLILIPFLIISSTQINQYKMNEKFIDYLEYTIEEASYDASFAMKTFSRHYYDVSNQYHILIDHKSVIELFFDSLDFRGFDYSDHEFVMLVFVEFDGIVIYIPHEEIYLPKVYYSIEEGGNYLYTDLSGGFKKINIESMMEIDSGKIDASLFESIVLSSIERGLNKAKAYSEKTFNLNFSLPLFKSSLFANATTDMCFIPLYISDYEFQTKPLQVMTIAPSGIMKIKEESLHTY